MNEEQHKRKLEYDRKWRMDNKERKAEYDKMWRSEHPGYGLSWYIENKEKRRDYNKSLRSLREAENREYQAKYRKDHKDRVAAHNALTRAVAAGRVARPESCDFCGVVGPVDGHHPDYSSPLYVLWLCRSCHNNLSAKEL